MIAALQLLPALPPDDEIADPDPPGPALPLWTGWSLGASAGRVATAHDDAPSPALVPDAIDPPAKLLRCRSCGNSTRDPNEHFYHRCATARFPLVIMWDFQITKPGRRQKNKRKCSPLPRARTKNLAKHNPGARARAAEERTKDLWDVDVQALRPKTRGDCRPGGPGPNAYRPCAFVGCRHHMAFTFDSERPSIKENFPYLRIYDDPEGPGLMALEALVGTCGLDIADRLDDGTEGAGGLLALYEVASAGQPIGVTEGFTLDETRTKLNLSLERTRQIGARAMQDVRVALRRLEGAAPGVRRGR